MAITIPNPEKVKPMVDTVVRKPSSAKTAMVNPGPVFISKTGASGSGVPLVEPRGGVASPDTNEGYYGFSVSSNTPGDAADDEAYGVVAGCSVTGFAGVSPGLDVFIDPTARPDPESTFSGLTHTVPAGGRGLRIGVGISTTAIYFFDK